MTAIFLISNFLGDTDMESVNYGLVVEVFIPVSFVSAYNLIEAYENTLSANNADQAIKILQQLESKMAFMKQSYLDAQREGRSQTAAFIDFEKDFSYLIENLQEAKKRAVIQQMCSNFTQAMNFKETRQTVL